jgi:hypothetical protein
MWRSSNDEGEFMSRIQSTSRMQAARLALAALGLAALVALLLGPGASANANTASAPGPGSSAKVAPSQGHASASAPQRTIGGLYNKRYCEIFTVFPATDIGFPVTIYNTIGLNDCPTATWDSLNFAAIATAEGAAFAVPNGPRRWVVDSVIGSTPGPAKDFGGLMMREVASTVTTTLSPPPFTVTTIRRNNSWVFRKGRTIREMVSPTGRRFVMQAFTNTVDPELKLSTLNSIGSNPLAAMPTGWKFRTRKLRRKLTVTATGEAKIVRDGLRSVYQLHKVPKSARR